MSTKPITWADGYGNWHARVAPGDIDAARAAINAEIQARDSHAVEQRVKLVDYASTIYVEDGPVQ